MPIVVGIQLRRTRDPVYGDAGHLDLQVNRQVVMETADGQEVGLVVEAEHMVESVKEKVYRVLRELTGDDRRRIAENRERACRALRVVKDSIESRNLAMKLTCVDYIFDRSKLFVYYTADNRVDFRALIKELGHTLRVRIQMVQIGVRDEAKILGGIGSCGQVLCCRRFLKEFFPVTMEMAKEQDIPLNTAKISGVCGRLMCCIEYEHKNYSAARKKMPRVKTRVMTPRGAGIVTAINCLTEEVTVDLGEGRRVAVSYKEITSA